MSPSQLEEDGSNSSVIQVGENESKADLIYGQSDPFARSIPRQSKTGAFLYFREDYVSNLVEQVDEERGWLWGTKVSKKNSTRALTPGLGVGRYRSKHEKNTARISDDLYRSDSEEVDELKEELIFQNGGPAQLDGEPAKARQGIYTSFPSIGASYLLTRLKESISRRSRFSSLGSSNTKHMTDPSRGRWNEIGQLVSEDEIETADGQKTVSFQKHIESNIVKRELSLADIALPEIPALTWDICRNSNNSNSNASARLAVEQDTSLKRKNVSTNTYYWVS